MSFTSHRRHLTHPYLCIALMSYTQPVAMSSSLLADDLMGEDVKSQVSDIASTSFGPSRGQRTPQKQVLHAACCLGTIYKSFIKYVIFINNQSRVCCTLLSLGQKSKRLLTFLLLSEGGAAHAGDHTASRQRAVRLSQAARRHRRRRRRSTVAPRRALQADRAQTLQRQGQDQRSRSGASQSRDCRRRLIMPCDGQRQYVHTCTARWVFL